MRNYRTCSDWPVITASLRLLMIIWMLSPILSCTNTQDPEPEPLADLLKIEVTPDHVEIPLGSTVGFMVTAYYVDGSSFNISQDATWSQQPGCDGSTCMFEVNSSIPVNSVSDDLQLRSVSRGDNDGETTLRFSYRDGKTIKSADATVKINQAVLSGVSVVATGGGGFEWPLGFDRHFQVRADYSDGNFEFVTQQYQFAIEDTLIADITGGAEAPGLVSSFTVGETFMLMAPLSDDMPPIEPIKISILPPVLVSIDVINQADGAVMTGLEIKLPRNEFFELGLVGNYSNGARVIEGEALALEHWQVANPSVVSISLSEAVRLTSLSGNGQQSQVNYSLGNITSSFVIKSIPGKPDEIRIQLYTDGSNNGQTIPANVTAGLGFSVQAIGVYGPEKNEEVILNDFLDWSVESTDGEGQGRIVSMPSGNSSSNIMQFESIQPGAVNIKAAYADKQVLESLFIDPPGLKSLRLRPSPSEYWMTPGIKEKFQLSVEVRYTNTNTPSGWEPLTINIDATFATAMPGLQLQWTDQTLAYEIMLLNKTDVIADANDRVNIQLQATAYDTSTITTSSVSFEFRNIVGLRMSPSQFGLGPGETGALDVDTKLSGGNSGGFISDIEPDSSNLVCNLTLISHEPLTVLANDAMTVSAVKGQCEVSANDLLTKAEAEISAQWTLANDTFITTVEDVANVYVLPKIGDIDLATSGLEVPVADWSDQGQSHAKYYVFGAVPGQMYNIRLHPKDGKAFTSGDQLKVAADWDFTQRLCVASGMNIDSQDLSCNIQALSASIFVDVSGVSEPTVIRGATPLIGGAVDSAPFIMSAAIPGEYNVSTPHWFRDVSNMGLIAPNKALRVVVDCVYIVSPDECLGEVNQITSMNAFKVDRANNHGFQLSLFTANRAWGTSGGVGPSDFCVGIGQNPATTLACVLRLDQAQELYLGLLAESESRDLRINRPHVRLSIEHTPMAEHQYSNEQNIPLNMNQTHLGTVQNRGIEGVSMSSYVVTYGSSVSVVNHHHIRLSNVTGSVYLEVIKSGPDDTGTKVPCPEPQQSNLDSQSIECVVRYGDRNLSDNHYSINVYAHKTNDNSFLDTARQGGSRYTIHVTEEIE